MSIFWAWGQVSKHLTLTGFIQVGLVFPPPSHMIIKMKELNADSLPVQHNFLQDHFYNPAITGWSFLLSTSRLVGFFLYTYTSQLLTILL